MDLPCRTKLVTKLNTHHSPDAERVPIATVDPNSQPGLAPMFLNSRV